MSRPSVGYVGDNWVEASQLLWIGGGLALLCVVLVIVGTVLQAVGTVFNLVGGILQLVVNLFNTGPLPGCGCVVAVGGLVICGMLAYSALNLYATCNGPNPVNFCVFLGR